MQINIFIFVSIPNKKINFEVNSIWNWTNRFRYDIICWNIEMKFWFVKSKTRIFFWEIWKKLRNIFNIVVIVRSNGHLNRIKIIFYNIVLFWIGFLINSSFLFMPVYSYFLTVAKRHYKCPSVQQIRKLYYFHQDGIRVRF